MSSSTAQRNGRKRSATPTPESSSIAACSAKLAAIGEASESSHFAPDEVMSWIPKIARLTTVVDSIPTSPAVFATEKKFERSIPRVLRLSPKT